MSQHRICPHCRQPIPGATRHGDDFSQARERNREAAMDLERVKRRTHEGFVSFHDCPNDPKRARPVAREGRPS